jgi:immunity protein, SdpI family
MRKWYPWVLVAAAFVFTAVVVNRLPERVPTHWNAHGEVNGWSSRAFAAWLMPAMMGVIALILPLLPNIDPRRANYDKFRGTYDFVVLAIIAMLGVLHVAVLGSALGWPISMARLTPLMIGALFLLLGNVMPRARPNWWFGIRTPWTMSNDRVWERTHRVGGYVFAGAGVMLMLLAVLLPSMALPVIVVVAVTAGIVPLVYSYVAWKQETRP